MASFDDNESKLVWVFKTEREAYKASKVFEQAFGPAQQDAQAPTVEV
jgi:hypothetical protein